MCCTSALFQEAPPLHQHSPVPPPEFPGRSRGTGKTRAALACGMSYHVLQPGVAWQLMVVVGQLVFFCLLRFSGTSPLNR